MIKRRNSTAVCAARRAVTRRRHGASFLRARRPRIRSGAALFALALSVATPTLAVEPDEILADPKLEQRAREISKGLRCLVCRNQSIDDSDAGLARDLRIAVRQRLTAGDTDTEVVDFVVERYGDYVLLRPRFTMESAMLYLGGPLLLVLGAFGFRRVLRRGQTVETAPEPASLSEEEARRVRDLMADDGRS